MGEASQQEPTEDTGGHQWALVEAVARQPVAIGRCMELLLSHPAADLLHPWQENLTSLVVGGLWYAPGGSAHVGSKGERLVLLS